VFVCTPSQWKAHDWGSGKVDFVLRNLRGLSDRLQRLNVPLLIEKTPDFAGVPDLLERLAKRHRCDSLFFNRELEVNERRRDSLVEERFRGSGVSVHSFDDQTLMEPGEIRTGAGGFYTVYTPFRKAVLRRLAEVGFPTVLPAPRRQEAMPCRPGKVPGVVDGFDPRGAGSEQWDGGEVRAHALLQTFLKAGAHAYDRKRDQPAEDATSRIGPYLAAGVLSIRRTFAEALLVNRGRIEGGDPGLGTWMDQLIWREFYRHVLRGYPRVSMNRPFRLKTERVVWSEDQAAFRAWCEGRTGYPIVDAGMRQLRETGWMHNRLRMITAMFLTKHLLIDWRWGERFFMRHLLDGDLANNNGGWQWSASTGTDAAPYFRIMNPWVQSRRFDPEGRFIRRHVPELAEVPGAALHDPNRLRQALGPGHDYPDAIVEHRFARARAMKAYRDALREEGK
jgi:deoxyribodipyrimidine photo-lyase